VDVLKGKDPVLLDEPEIAGESDPAPAAVVDQLRMARSRDPPELLVDQFLDAVPLGIDGPPKELGGELVLRLGEGAGQLGELFLLGLGGKLEVVPRRMDVVFYACLTPFREVPPEFSKDRVPFLSGLADLEFVVGRFDELGQGGAEGYQDLRIEFSVGHVGNVGPVFWFLVLFW